VGIFPIDFADIRDENKLRIGFQVLEGVLFPIANRISVEAQFKANFAKATLTDFVGFEPFDMNGLTFLLGMNYWF